MDELAAYTARLHALNKALLVVREELLDLEKNAAHLCRATLNAREKRVAQCLCQGMSSKRVYRDGDADGSFPQKNWGKTVKNTGVFFFLLWFTGFDDFKKKGVHE